MFNKNRTRLFFTKKNSVAIAITCTLFATVTNAQQVDNKGDEDSLAIERIVVTSQKREKNIEQVPISISAMNSDVIEQTGIKELQEIDEYIPNLQISKGNSYNTTINIRGVGSSSRNIGFDSRVGVYVDGVYMGQSPATNQDILDLERVEVLRGPQGTLFGKNTVAGAINILTKKPTDEFEGKIKVDIGNMNSKRIAGSINVPITDDTFVKLAVNKQSRDGYIHNIPTDSQLGEQDGTSYRLKLLTNITDQLEASIAIDRLDSERKLYTGSTVGSRAALLEPSTKEYTSLFGFIPNEEREVSGASLTLNYDFDNGGLFKSISAVRDTYSYFETDLDAGISYVAGNMPGTPITIGFAFGITGDIELNYMDEYKQLSQEFQYISPGNEKFQYVAGIYLYNQEGNTERLAVGHHDRLHPFYVDGDLPFPGDDFHVLNTYGTVDTKSYAVYINGTYQLTDNLTLGFGGRYSIEEKEVDWTSDPSDSAQDVLGVGITLNAAFQFYDGRYLDSHEDSHFSPEVSLNYAVSDEMNAYYRASTGFKSGGFNLDFITAAQFAGGLEFDKETVMSHEIGLKGSLFNRRLTYRTAYFDANYDDYQVQQFLPSNGAVAGAAVIGNASEVATKGLELELDARVTENLSITSAIGLLDAKFVDFPGGGKDENGDIINLAGARLAGAPDKTFNLGVQYYYPVDSLDSELLFRLDYAYVGDRFLTGNNEEEKTRTLANGDEIEYLYITDTHNINARIGYILQNGWSVSLWGRNLADENNSSIGTNIFGSYLRVDSLPRTYGIDITYNF